jgi:hypothetical protein|tara:strand:+ start:1974 stop:2228 length:255 start_codon:yes stop_codon:yes gene_type:complete
MKITKELKYASFTWHDANKEFTVTDSNNNTIELNKAYGFALMRFIIRIAQKNFSKKSLQKEMDSDIIEEIEENFEDPRQIKFSF